MKIEEAYSEDYGDNIDAETAYDLFWSGTIKNKRNFTCPDPSCNVKITCANLDRPRDQMKVQPYFKYVEPHETECDFYRQFKDAQVEDPEKKRRRRSGTPLDDVLHFQRPPSHYEVKRQESTKKVKGTGGIEGNPKQPREKKKPSQNTKSHRYSISPIVSKYLSGEAKSLFVMIDKVRIPYEKLFVNIKKEKQYQGNRIYFGKAYVNMIDAKSYSIQFLDTLEIADLTKKPSIYIRQELIEKSFRKNMFNEMFKRHVAEKRPVFVFVYSKPTTTGKFINFKIANLDFLDFQESIQTV